MIIFSLSLLKIGLSREELTLLKWKLEEVMANERPYLDQEITLNGLAKLVGTSDKKLSALLNQSLAVSFYDFINSYRIDFAKDMIAQSQDKKQTILEVMYASGFNSKSSFNTAFKKHAKFTPSEWKNKFS